MENKYRFLDQDPDTGKKCHRHQLLVNGEWRDMTGGSTVVDVLGKQLSYWAAGLAVKTFSGIEDAKVLTKIKNGKATESELETTNEVVTKWLEDHPNPTTEQWIKLCQEAYSNHAKSLDDSAKKGTDMHAVLEEYVKSCGVKSDNVPYLVESGEQFLMDFSKWAVDNIAKFIWSEGHCFNAELFVGGITDCGALFKDGSYGIVDFKSSKEAYFSQFVQTAIYDLLVKMSGLVDRNGELIVGMDSKDIKKYVIIPFGAKEFMAVENTNVVGLKKAGLACVELYREKMAFENK